MNMQPTEIKMDNKITPGQDKTFPLLSILLTAYNRNDFIGEAIESFLSCTYPNLELIIVDDNSTDDTASIARKYEQMDTRIKLFVNEKNLGQFINRNKIVSYAAGDYILYLDSDDKILADGLLECVNAMQAYPNASVGTYWPYSSGAPFLLSSKEIITEHFFKRQVLVNPPGCTILKKGYFEKIAGFSNKYGLANDMHYNLKLACYSDVVLFPFKFFFYRVHSGQEKHNWYGYVYNNYLFLKDALNELPLPLSAKEKEWIGNKNKRRFLRNIIRYFFHTRNFKQVKEALKKTGFSIKDCFNAVFHV